MYHENARLMTVAELISAEDEKNARILRRMRAAFNTAIRRKANRKLLLAGQLVSFEVPTAPPEVWGRFLGEAAAAGYKVQFNMGEDAKPGSILCQKAPPTPPMPVDARESIEQTADDFERKAKSLREMIKAIGDNPDAADRDKEIRLTAKASVYEEEGRRLRRFLQQ